MTPRSKQMLSNARPSRMRLSLWLLVLASGLIMLVAICLPRPDSIKPPAQPAQAPGDTAGQDALALSAGNVPPTRTRPVMPASEPAQKTLAGWVLDLKSTNAEVVYAARKALDDLGPDAAPAIPQLAQMLGDGLTCNSAAWALVKIGTNALPVLIEALTNGNKYARLEVAGAISLLRDAAAEAVPALVECIGHEDPGVRGNAIASLQAIPKRPDIAVPALIAALADPDATVHDNAQTVLREYAHVAADATIPALVQAARQEQNPLSIRFRAAEIVRAVAPERAQAEGL